MATGVFRSPTTRHPCLRGIVLIHCSRCFQTLRLCFSIELHLGLRGESSRGDLVDIPGKLVSVQEVNRLCSA